MIDDLKSGIEVAAAWRNVETAQLSARIAELEKSLRFYAEMFGPATRDVVAERRRQIEADGWDTGHDDEYVDGELAAAAAAYAISSRGDTAKREDLVRAGALILAEIERLDRVAMAAKQEASNE